jgi:hypothetical protein
VSGVMYSGREALHHVVAVVAPEPMPMDAHRETLGERHNCLELSDHLRPRQGDLVRPSSAPALLNSLLSRPSGHSVETVAAPRGSATKAKRTKKELSATNLRENMYEKPELGPSHRQTW